MVTTSNIYLITNKINNKKYIGQSASIEERWYRHSVDYKRLTDRYLYRAMNKYGFNNFKFEILETDIDISLIHEKEKHWIKELNTKAPYGYNMTDGGEGSFNRLVSEETKEKLRQANLGKTASDETKKKFSVITSKRFEDINERKKISDSMKKNEKAIEKAIINIQAYNNSVSKEQKKLNMNKAIESRSKSVIAKNIKDEETLEFNSIRKAAEWIRQNTEFEKACHTNISKACRGKIDYVYGFYWCFK